MRPSCHTALARCVGVLHLLLPQVPGVAAAAQHHAGRAHSASRCAVPLAAAAAGSQVPHGLQVGRRWGCAQLLRSMHGGRIPLCGTSMSRTEQPNSHHGCWHQVMWKHTHSYICTLQPKSECAVMCSAATSCSLLPPAGVRCAAAGMSWQKLRRLLLRRQHARLKCMHGSHRGQL